MPINAMIPMSGTKLTVPDEQGMAVRAQNIISSKDTMRRNAVLDAQRKTKLDNAEMDAEQKASLEGMARIHQTEQGWVNKYMQDGMGADEANQKAIETVAPYAQQEIDHHNKRFGTQYTIDDVNKARAPMQQIMSKYQQEMGLLKQKGKNALIVEKQKGVNSVNKKKAGNAGNNANKPDWLKPDKATVEDMKTILTQYIDNHPEFEGEGVPEGAARAVAGAFLALVKKGVPHQQALQQAVESVGGQFNFHKSVLNDTLTYNPLKNQGALPTADGNSASVGSNKKLKIPAGFKVVSQ